jgi:hypothetical protein
MKFMICSKKRNVKAYSVVSAYVFTHQTGLQSMHPSATSGKGQVRAVRLKGGISWIDAMSGLVLTADSLPRSRTAAMCRKLTFVWTRVGGVSLLWMDLLQSDA